MQLTTQIAKWRAALCCGSVTVCTCVSAPRMDCPLWRWSRRTVGVTGWSLVQLSDSILLSVLAWSPRFGIRYSIASTCGDSAVANCCTRLMGADHRTQPPQNVLVLRADPISNTPTITLSQHRSRSIQVTAVNRRPIAHHRTSPGDGIHVVFLARRSAELTDRQLVQLPSCLWARRRHESTGAQGWSVTSGCTCTSFIQWSQL